MGVTNKKKFIFIRMGDKKIVGPQCNMVYRKKKLGKETTELIKTYNGE